jgi:hypothetical protein
MIDLVEYLREITEYNYALCKIDVPYMTKNFPESYPVGKDLDVYVSYEDYANIISHTKKYFLNCDYIKKYIQTENNFRLRLIENKKLHYQIDITFSDDYVKNRKHRNYFYEVSLETEIKIRQNEVVKNPRKKHHREWLKKWMK